MQRLLGQVLSCPVLVSRLQSPSAVGALSTPDPKEKSGREHQHQPLGTGTPGARYLTAHFPVSRYLVLYPHTCTYLLLRPSLNLPLRYRNVIYIPWRHMWI